ncbi:SCO5555 family protein [Actinocorallia aurea]
MGAEDDRSGPAWDDPLLMLLAAQLRTAHQRISPLPRETRRRLHRQLLAITDLAKRDHELAARRLGAFLDDMDTGPSHMDSGSGHP